MGVFKDLTGQKFGRLIVLKDSGKRYNGNVIWECLCDCGKTCFVQSRNLRTGNTKSCGCLHKEIASNMCQSEVGEKSRAWKGGVSPIRNLDMNRLEYKEWRTQVFERDTYICQKCKQTGGTLNAHHIEAYNNNPGLRTEIANGITLCKECHKNFHHQYGNSCTKNQLNKFLEKIKEES